MIRGYVTSRCFGGLCIPVPAQNSCLRELARARSVAYALPPLEHKFENCYMQLFTVLNTADQGDMVAMYSVTMLPINNHKKMNHIDSIAREKDLTLYFILEGIECLSLKSISNIISSYKIREMYSGLHKLDLAMVRDQIATLQMLND